MHYGRRIGLVLISATASGSISAGYAPGQAPARQDNGGGRRAAIVAGPNYCYATGKKVAASGSTAPPHYAGASARPAPGLIWKCYSPSNKLISAPAMTGVPMGIAAGAGSVYFTVSSLPQIKRVRKANEVAGIYPPAGFEAPTEIAFRRPAGLYVAEPAKRRVRFFNFGKRSVRVNGVAVAGGKVRTIASASGPGASPRPAGANQAVYRAISDPKSLAVSRGSLFIAGAGSVVRIDARGKSEVVTPGPGCCIRPESLAATTAGNLYVGDQQSGLVWFLNLGPSTASANGQSVPAGGARVVAGVLRNPPGGPAATAQEVGGDGGPAVAAHFLSVASLAAGPEGEVYVADDLESTVRKVDASGTASTIAGTGQPGFNGDASPSQLTMLSAPARLAVDGCNLFIADWGTDLVRTLKLVPCPPTFGVLVH